MKRNFTATLRFPWIAVAGLATSVAAFSIVSAPHSSAAAGKAAEPAQTRIDQDALAVAEQLSNAFGNVAEAIEPGVVSIRTTQEVRVHTMQFAPGIPEEFRRFFRFPDERATPERRVQEGQGSGFVVSGDGYIITNNHVIDDADSITVAFTDGRSYSAKLVGADPQTDIAVLKVQAEDLTPLSLGDSDSLRVGQFVLAAGSPFGLNSTITAGVVSATGRSRVGLVDYENFIQTDATVNPGNSGGPLVNLRGEVVGVNSAILSRSGGNNGIGFAIPINMVKTIKDTLIAEGHVARGRLGVLIQDLTSELAESFGYRSTTGAVVGDVQPDTPAEKVGLRSGDIINELNGKPIPNATELRFRVAETKPGTTVKLGVFRDGKTIVLTPTIAPMDDQRTASAARDEKPVGDKLGAEIVTLTPPLAARMGMPAIKGVIVTGLDPLGGAVKSGLQVGDVIVAVVNTPVKTVSEFEHALAGYPNARGVRITVQNDSGVRFLMLRLAD